MPNQQTRSAYMEQIRDFALQGEDFSIPSESLPVLIAHDPTILMDGFSEIPDAQLLAAISCNDSTEVGRLVINTLNKYARKTVELDVRDAIDELHDDMLVEGGR